MALMLPDLCVYLLVLALILIPLAFALHVLLGYRVEVGYRASPVSPVPT